MPNPHSIHDAKFIRQATNAANQQPMLQVLRAYCLGMLKACGYVNERIKSEHFYEVSIEIISGHQPSAHARMQEEDFVTNTYSRTLLSNLSTSAIQEVLAEAKELLISQRAAIGDDVVDALISRLELRRIFLAATECPQYVKEPAKARQPWSEALSILPSIDSTHSLGTSVEEAFSAKLQRKLASTMPPRPIVDLKFGDAFGHLSRLFKDGSEIIGVLEYTDSQCLQVNALRRWCFVPC